MADQWASAPELHGELAEAEEVAAKLVEVICDLDWALRTEQEVANGFLAQRDAARADLSDRTEEVSLLRQQRDEARAEVEKWRAKWSLAVAEKVAVEAAFAALREQIATQIEEYGGPPQCDCEVCRYCYWSRAIEGAARIARDKGVERNG